jgi:S-adenosylmethionine:tRNA ribosyltransferase-isomerase
MGLIRGKVKPGETLLAGEAVLTAGGKQTDGSRFIHTDIPVQELLALYGQTPLPPYIRRQADRDDSERYQTVYAANAGSVAAPTAGLHFTPDLLKAFEDRGVASVYITLHVGIGTFRPMKTESLDEHEMHSESYFISPDAAQKINMLRQNGKKLVAVGTTTVRALESAADDRGNLTPGAAGTKLFIKPGYRFKLADGLITNFHLPKSSLLVLVSAFAGRELLFESYKHAIKEKYRFYSYGDAMYITAHT